MDHLLVHFGFAGASVVCCMCHQERSQVPLGDLRLEPFDKPQISQEVCVGVVDGVLATGVQLAPMAPLPNAAEAQEPEIGAPLPYVDTASQHPLEYAYARSQEGQ